MKITLDEFQDNFQYEILKPTDYVETSHPIQRMVFNRSQKECRMVLQSHCLWICAQQYNILTSWKLR